ncbi:MAG: hypothetical protein K5756_09780 [Clostridiales bacterium]|nr:hypothetical protein [Clostridiales bacterium]
MLLDMISLIDPIFESKITVIIIFVVYCLFLAAVISIIAAVNKKRNKKTNWIPIIISVVISCIILGVQLYLLYSDANAPRGGPMPFDYIN